MSNAIRELAWLRRLQAVGIGCLVSFASHTAVSGEADAPKPGPAAGQPGHGAPRPVTQLPAVQHGRLVLDHDVEVSARGWLQRNGRPLLRGQLHTMLRGAEGHYPGRPLRIKADRQAPMSAIMYLQETARFSGCRSLEFVAADDMVLDVHLSMPAGDTPDLRPRNETTLILLGDQLLLLDEKGETADATTEALRRRLASGEGESAAVRLIVSARERLGPVAQQLDRLIGLAGQRTPRFQFTPAAGQQVVFAADPANPARIPVTEKMLEEAAKQEIATAATEMEPYRAEPLLLPEELTLRGRQSMGKIDPVGTRILPIHRGGRWLFLDQWYIAGPLGERDGKRLDKGDGRLAKLLRLRETPTDLILPGGKREASGFDWVWSTTVRTVPPRADRHAHWFAWTEVHAEADMEVWMGFGADEAASAWIDGQLVYESLQPQAWNPVAAMRKVELKKGFNRILIRLLNGDGTTGFSVVVAPHDGGDDTDEPPGG